MDPRFSGHRISIKPALLFRAGIFLIFLLGFAVRSNEQDTPTGYVPGEVLVGVYADNDTPDTETHIKLVGSVMAHDVRIHAFHLKLAPNGSVPDAILALKSQDGIRYAEPNWTGHLNSTPNDPMYSATDTSTSSPRHGLSYQYGPQRIMADLAWGIWQPRRQVIIAFVDTGIDNLHEDLTGKILRDTNGIIGYNSIDDPYPLTTRSDAMDDEGHGTECAGVAAAQINNSKGIAGIAGWDGQSGDADVDIKLMPVKAVTASKEITAQRVADGIRWAADNGANVINVSLSLYNNQSSTVLTDSTNYAWNKGCLIVAAPDNVGSTAYSYPAHDPNVISVAASDSTDKIAGFSTYGTWVTIAAPGGQGAVASSPTITEAIYTTGLSTPYVYDWGTSLAAPHVSGEAALIWAQNPALNNYQMSALITGNTDAVTPYSSGRDISNDTRVNAYKALQNTYGFNWKAVALVDINGDHVPDIVFQNQTSGDLYYWLMAWSSGTPSQLTYSSGSYFYYHNPGDMPPVF
jgi:thermitase